MSIAYGTEHRQVPLLIGDRFALVDEGMRNIIAILWRAGVGTNYSCQGDAFGGYFLSDMRSALPSVFKAAFKRGLSPEAKRVRRGFLKGVWELMWWDEEFYGKEHRFKDGSIWVDTRRGLRLRNVESYQRYALEFTYHREFGFRFTARWPAVETPAFERFLSEVFE